ncbi:HK97 gp10 family phage protein [Peptococcaceae bacterium 1198_IL3148]
MARRWGRVDYRQLQKLQKRMERLEKVDYEKFCEAMAKELAARLLAKVIKRTPVADPSKWKKPVKGYVGGTLRRGWTAGKQHWTETKDGKLRTKGIGGKSGYAQSLEVVKRGNVFEIYVINNVEYALT